jgi:Phosphatidylserine synthase
LISKIPTYSFKRITIPRSTTIFLLFGIGLYFGLIFIYTFEVLFITGAVYLCTIPISYLHFRRLNSKEKTLTQAQDIDESEDIL